jgi:sulfatase modifying factor 1
MRCASRSSTFASRRLPEPTAERLLVECTPWRLVSLALCLAALPLLACSRKEPEKTSAPGEEPANPPLVEPAPHVAPPQSAAAPKVPRFTSDQPRPLGLGPVDTELRKRPVREQQAYLKKLIAAYERLDEEARKALFGIIDASELLSFGNPEVSRPAQTQKECDRAWAGLEAPQMSEECPRRNMVRVSEELCVDMFEFPNVRCEYPVVWVRASEASAICESLGKRLCDAHEWEGACAGEVRPATEEYDYARVPKGEGAEYRRSRRILMEGWHNQARTLVWAYGPQKDHSRCGTGAQKSSGCDAVSYQRCGTNDYPAGAFPECRTPTGIFDQHGNVAEHMNFPLYPEELGGKGYTEMKGSWFLFAREETHPDDCRWRAKNWHTTKIKDPNSHRNYHLGFRCCADMDPSSDQETPLSKEK